MFYNIKEIITFNWKNRFRQQTGLKNFIQWKNMQQDLKGLSSQEIETKRRWSHGGNIPMSILLIIENQEILMER